MGWKIKFMKTWYNDNKVFEIILLPQFSIFIARDNGFTICFIFGWLFGLIELWISSTTNIGNIV